MMQVCSDMIDIHAQRDANSGTERPGRQIALSPSEMAVMCTCLATLSHEFNVRTSFNQQELMFSRVGCTKLSEPGAESRDMFCTNSSRS